MESKYGNENLNCEFLWKSMKIWSVVCCTWQPALSGLNDYGLMYKFDFFFNLSPDIFAFGQLTTENDQKFW